MVINVESHRMVSYCCLGLCRTVDVMKMCMFITALTKFYCSSIDMFRSGEKKLDSSITF